MVDTVYYFIDEKGKNPVWEFIQGLPKSERIKIAAYVKELKLQGHNLHRPMADYLGHGIYELRPKDNRVFYFFYLKNNVVLVHALRKKTDKIPEGDLRLCLKRKAIVEEFNRNLEQIDGENL